MKAIPLILSLILLSGCLVPSKTKSSPPAADARYPLSEIERIYDIVLDGMTTKYFANFPEIDKAHTKPMRDYITASYPRDKFLRDMIREEYRPAMERALTDVPFRDTKEFKEAFGIIVNVSVPIAKMAIGGQRDIYVAQFVEKNPVKVELFAMATSDDERQYISWVSDEITVGPETKLQDAGDEYHYAEGDRVFSFNSPEETWLDLCGRAGFIVVRNGKIAQILVTLMN